jgi:hypothetical protein
VAVITSWPQNGQKRAPSGRERKQEVHVALDAINPGSYGTSPCGLTPDSAGMASVRR